MRTTCKWCGKSYDLSQSSSGYCSKRCEVAAERERQRKQKEADEFFEERKRKKQEIIKRGGLGAKLVLIGDVIKWLAIIAVAIWFIIKYIQFKQ